MLSKPSACVFFIVQKLNGKRQNHYDVDVNEIYVGIDIFFMYPRTCTLYIIWTLVHENAEERSVIHCGLKMKKEICDLSTEKYCITMQVYQKRIYKTTHFVCIWLQTKVLLNTFSK